MLRQLSPLALPVSRLQSAASLDLITSTPFKLDQVKLLPVTGAVQASSYAIVKNSVLEPILSAFQGNGIKVASIAFEPLEQRLQLVPGAHNFSANGRRVRSGMMASVFISMMAIAIGATAAHAYLRNEAAINRLNADIETLGSAAKVARKALDQHAATLAELNNLRRGIEDTEPISVVWEELAIVLPDTAYLTDFSVKSGQVTIAGYAEAAAALVVALEQSPRFSKVGFMAPVVKTPGMDGERFEIGLAVGGTN